LRKARFALEVLPVLRPPAYVVEEAARVVEEAFGAEARILPEAPPPPRELFDERRRQYKAELLLAWSSSLRAAEGSLLLAVVSADAYASGLNFVFGIASPRLGASAVFLPRLRYLAAPSLFLSRLAKEVLHEVGHVLGLGHCENRKCVMAFSNSIYDTDYKEAAFCRKCASLLASAGYELGAAYVLR